MYWKKKLKTIKDILIIFAQKLNEKILTLILKIWKINCYFSNHIRCYQKPHEKLMKFNPLMKKKLFLADDERGHLILVWEYFNLGELCFFRVPIRVNCVSWKEWWPRLHLWRFQQDEQKWKFNFNSPSQISWTSGFFLSIEWFL